jgi:predicted RecA/RadA family phage recombinase
MAYTGQPVPSTVYDAARAKVSDGKSVRVAVPESTAVEAGKFYLLGGFLGVAMQSVTTGAGETAEVILNIEPAEFETDQIKATDKASMTAGADIYWDDAAGAKHFTVTAKAVYAGKITAAADDNNVIWFKLAERPFALDDFTTLAAAVGDLGDLTTTAKNSIVAALNELDAKAAAKVDAIADPGEETTAAAVATQLNALITALTAAGLMSDSE